MPVTSVIKLTKQKAVEVLKKFYRNKSLPSAPSLKQLGQLYELELYRHSGHFSLHDIKQYYKSDPWTLNYIINAWEFAKGVTALSSYPYDIAFAINADCNANCIFCLTKPYRQKYSNCYLNPLDWERFKTLLKYAHAVGIPGPGEPLLHPRFQELIDNLSQFIDNRCNVYLITNGLLHQQDLTQQTQY